MNGINSRVFLLLLSLMLMLLTGCRSFILQPSEKVLKGRVAEMMTARVDQDWGSVYYYLDPEYKEQITKDSFQSIARNTYYRNFRIDSVHIDPSGDNARVVVQYDMTMMGFEVPDHRELQEWIKSGGKWYLLVKTGSLMETE